MARIARQILASLVLIGAAFAFLAPGEAAGRVAGILASWQLFPAAERAALEALSGFRIGGAVSCLAAAAIILGTLLLGRWYCSALCPLGTLQDLASLFRHKKRAYRRRMMPLRLAVLLAAVVLASLGSASLAAMADPWSIFSRFLAYDLKSLVGLARKEDLPGLSLAALIVSGSAALAVLAASVFSGRWFCGAICPVGTTLGLLNAASPFRIRLDSESCVSCGACAKVCRAACIDAIQRALDTTRCVNCLACLEACPRGAIRYGTRRGGLKGQEKHRRPATQVRKTALPMDRAQFLASLGKGALALSALLVSPRLAFPEGGPVAPGEDSEPSTPVLPPGAGSLARFTSTCIGCGLCVARCPSKVLQPSLGQPGGKGFLAPRLDHGISYCQYDCRACMDACPSGALERLPTERKRLAKIGDATLVRTRCVVFTNRTKCGACAEHCPTGAVMMAVGETGLPEPVFTSAICIGCGACHHACPVRPLRAISVSGLAIQGMAEKPSPKLFDKPEEGKDQEKNGEDANAFPF